MKKIGVFSIATLLIVINIQCASSLKPQYKLVKKFPLDLPDLQMKIVNDSMGELISVKEKSSQPFRFKRWKRNFLVVGSTEDSELKLLKIGDTIVHYKRELLIYNERFKLTFKE